jgi:MFS family permease
MMSVQAMTTLGVVTVPVLAPAISAAVSVPSSSVGAYQSLAYAGGALLTLLSGSLVHRYGGVRINQVSVLVAAVGLAWAVSGAVALIALSALLVGMGYGLATPGASHVLARVTPAARRGLVFSVKQSAVPLGGLLAGVLLPPLAQRWGWQAAVLVAAVLVASAAVVIQPLRARLDGDRDPAHRVSLGAPAQAVRLVLATPALRVVALAAFSFGAMQLSLFAFLVTFLVERAGRDLVAAGLAFSVMQGAGVVARVLWGWVSDRFLSARPLLAMLGIGVIVSTAAAAAVSPQWPAWAVSVVCAAMGLTAVGWNGVYLAEVARVVPQAQVGPATGGVLMFTFLGIAVGPVTFGAVVAASGSYTPAFLVMNALVLFTVAALLRRRAAAGTGAVG